MAITSEEIRIKSLELTVTIIESLSSMQVKLPENYRTYPACFQVCIDLAQIVEGYIRKQ